MLLFWTYHSSKNPEEKKCITVSTKKQHSCFNIDNVKELKSNNNLTKLKLLNSSFYIV